jgi:glycosyltransferase involved in cell wall biosynthesis
MLLRRAARNLPTLSDTLDAGAHLPAPHPLPSLSVVVTARDEAAGIESTVRRLLAQRYPGLQIVVVDDRSSDGTAAILDRLQAETGRAELNVLHNRDLPPGWLGKCHACHLGAARARGDWILFMDGDVELARDDLLARVVLLAEERRLDHVALVPDQRPVSALQAALLQVFAQMYLLASRLHEMDRDRRRGGGGIGAFNLVRRAAYDRIHGHTLLKMDPADDFKLGRLLKESGARQRFFDAVGLVRCPWHKGALNVARGLEKNFFAGFNYSLLELVAHTVLGLALAFGPAATAVAGSLLAAAPPNRAMVLVVGWLPLVVQALVVWSGSRVHTQRQGGSPLVLSALYPAAILLLLAAAWNSAIRILARGGVVWRDTFYALDVLRAGLVPRGIGRRL